MISRRSWSLVLLGLSSTALAAAVGVAGCQSDSNSTGATDTGSGGEGNGSTTTASAQGGATSASTSGTGMTSSASGTGTGGAASCDAPEHTIEDITTGKLGPMTEITLKGVVAMSPKWLVFKSNSSGSCLWGVYVSAPGITETKANSGILVLSYGDEATTGDGGQAFCPKLGVDPVGGNIPDDVQPGDVLDINGKTDYYLPGGANGCGKLPTDSSVHQYQLLTNATACPIKKTGTAAVPTPHLLAAGDVAKLSSPTDTAFHDQWGGVKVRVENVASVPQTVNCPTDPGPCLLNKYGQMTVGTNLVVEDDIFFRAYLKMDNFCHDGPKYTTADGNFDFAAIQGFSTQDFCTWVLEPGDKCADLDPSSEDCTGKTCPPTN